MEFEESRFMAYVDNVFIKILHAIMFHKLETIDHFVGDEVYQSLIAKLEELDQKCVVQMYEMTNVKESKIVERKNIENKSIIEVQLTARYIRYVMNKNTNEIVSGNDERRVEKSYLLTFEKQYSGKKQGISRKCPGCGSNIDANDTGKCKYCGAIYDLENFDYILTNIKELI